jgi:hypothetical protein
MRITRGCCEPHDGQADVRPQTRLLAQINVNERDVRPEFTARLVGLRTGRHCVYHADPIALEQVGGSAEEVMVVVDDEATHGMVSACPM